MTTVVSSLTRIKIGIYTPATKKTDPKSKKTTTTKAKTDWYTIKAEEVSEGDSQDSEKLYVCENPEAEQVSFGQCEYSIELKGVLPQYKKFFRRLRLRQINANQYLPVVAIYEYEAGKWVLQSYYKGVTVGDIDRTKSDPFDVKMEALQQVYKNSKGELI